MTEQAKRGKWAIQAIACFLLAGVITVLLTYPVAFRLRHHVASDLGDPILCNWLLWWNYEHIFSMDFKGYWDAPIFYPHPKALGLAEHMFGPALVSAPVYAVYPSLPLCYNLLFLGTFFAALTGTVALARHLGRSWTASWLAGIIFAFCSHRYAQIPHLQTLFGGLAPWTFLFLLRLTKRPSILDALGLAAGYWLISFSCLYHAAFLSVLLAIAGAFLFFTRRLWRKPKSLALLAIAPALVGVSMIPVQRAYQQAKELFQIERSVDDLMYYSADVTSYLATSEHNKLLFNITRPFLRPEGDIYAGAVAVLLAACLLMISLVSAWRGTESAAISKTRRAAAWAGALLLAASLAGLLFVACGRTIRDRFGPLAFRLNDLTHPLMWAFAAIILLCMIYPRFRKAARRFWEIVGGDGMVMFLLLGAAAFVLSLGPKITINGAVIQKGPYFWLYEHVPGFSQMRVPSRFANYLMLSLGVLAAGGLDAIVSRIRYKWLGVAMGLALIGLSVTENFSVPLRVVRVPDIPRFYDWLAAQPIDGAILEMPLNRDYRFPDVAYQYFQTRHGNPLVNGYSGFYPRDSDELLWHLARDPEINPWLEAKLREFNPRLIILHLDSPEWDKNFQSPSMFLDSLLFEEVHKDGSIVALGWSDGAGR